MNEQSNKKRIAEIIDLLGDSSKLLLAILDDADAMEYLVAERLLGGLGDLLADAIVFSAAIEGRLEAA